MTHAVCRPVVLVVEDESLIRFCTAQTLEDAGCDVLEAANGDQALAIIDQRHDISVMFSDIAMPGSLDGLALAHRVHDAHPAIQLILTSGHGAPGAGQLPSDTRFVAKPYHAHELANDIVAKRT